MPRIFALVLALGCADPAAMIMIADAGVDRHTGAGDGRPVSCVWEGARRHADQGGAHVTDNASVAYNSNPPSSGPHCGTWLAYRVYAPGSPAPRCNWLHNLEHGAVVLVYRCPSGCPEIVAELEKAISEVSARCQPKPVILTPDDELDTTVAAAAWGATWRSSCLDAAARASLVAFIQEHMGPAAGQAPERVLACL